MSFLENSILEKHYIKGELLFDKGAVLEVVEVEKNLWSVMIRDEEILEVEIQNPNTKNQKSTCECEIYKKEKSCEHIATALLFLRKKEDERKLKRKEAKLTKQKFNLNTILSHIESEDLLKFIKSYAQSDRVFSIMLKATFARKIDIEDNRQKYESILSSLVKPISTENKTSSNSDLRIAIKVIKEFHSQLEDALSLNQFEESFLIIESCLPKLHYLYSNYNQRSEKVMDLLEKFHTSIDLLYDSQLAPALLERLDRFVFELFDKSYYNFLENILNLFHLAEKHHRKSLLQRLKQKIETTPFAKVKQMNYVVFTALHIQNKLYNKILVSDDTVIASIQYLLKLKKGQEVMEFMEHYLEDNPRNRKMEYTLATTYLELKETIKFREICAELYVTNTDIRYYRLLKENSNVPDWEKTKFLILDKIKALNPAPAFEARFYEMEKMNTELLSLLEEEGDLRLIMSFDFNLYKSDYLALERVYHKSIKTYLESHAGNIATRFIDEILNHLTQLRAHKLVSSIKQFIATNFPHRHHLSSFS